MENFTYAQIANAKTGEYELLLHGIVGWEIEGPKIAREIMALNDLGASKITLRINSVGGFIQEGLSVLAAMFHSKAEIHTFNEGTADSMASVILCAGDPGCRGGLDYSTAIVHDPLLGGVTLEEIEDEKVKSFMQKTKETLLTVYENNTGKSREEISEAMTEEVMLNAAEQKDFGLIDYVVKSQKQPKIKDGASILERMAACSDILSNHNNIMEKETTNITVNLADFEAVKSKFEAAAVKIKELEASIAERDEMIADKDGLIDSLRAENKEYRDDKISALVDKAIDSGNFDESDREFLTNLADSNEYEFKNLVDRMKAPQFRATDIISNQAPATDDPGDTRRWTWEDWEKNDPQGLARLEFSNPELYRKLEAADLAKYGTDNE